MIHRILALVAAAGLATAPAVGDEPAFVLERLGDGVSLVRPTTPAPDRTNSLVVEWADGLLVVDAQPTPASARAMLQVVAGDDPARVRYLVLSHGHDEAVGGASAFPTTTSILVAEKARLRLLDDAWDPSVESRLLGVPDGATLPRRPPSIGLPGGAVLAAAAPTVRLTPFADAHSPGDLLVEVPSLRLAWTGGVLVPPGQAPYAGDAHIASWIAGLNKLARSDFDVFVGLRVGPLDPGDVRRQRDGFGWLRATVESLILARTSVAELAATAKASPDLGLHYDLDRDQPFLDGLIERVVDEAVQERRKRGVILD